MMRIGMLRKTICGIDNRDFAENAKKTSLEVFFVIGQGNGAAAAKCLMLSCAMRIT